MKVLLLAQFYPPDTGGEEHHVRALAHALVDRGHIVTVATLWHPGMDRIEHDGAVLVYRIRAATGRITRLFSDEARRHAPPGPDPAIVHGLARVVKKAQPDVVHAHNWIVSSFIPLKNRSRAALLLSLHDDSLICVQKRLMRFGKIPCDGPAPIKCLACAKVHYGAIVGAGTVLARAALHRYEWNRIDLFLPVSEAVARLSRLDRTGRPYRIISNFIPDDLGTRATPASLEDLPNVPYIIYVGDAVADKGALTLLEAYAAASQSFEMPLVYVGRVADLAQASLTPAVRVLGPRSREFVVEALRRASAVVIPSLTPDACPTVALEAMAVGTPVVGSAIGGLTDIVEDGVSGILVPPGDVERLGQALKGISSSDFAQRRLSSGARRRSEAFRARNVVPQIEAAYRSLV